MDQKIQNLNNILQKKSVIPIVIGVLGALGITTLYFIIVPMVLRPQWTLVGTYNLDMQSIPTIEGIVLFLVWSVIIAALCTRLIGPGIKNPEEAHRTGKICGFVTSILTTIIFLMEGYFYSNPTSISILGIFFCILLIVISVYLQANAAKYQFLCDQADSQQQRDKNFSHPSKEGFLKRSFIVFIILIIFFIIVSPTIAYYGIQAGLVDRQVHGYMQNPVDVKRLDTNSIQITPYLSQKYYIDWGQKPIYQIFIDGKDVSSDITIHRQGLSDTIDHPQGLQYNNTSCSIVDSYYKCSPVVISGPDISNKTGPRHLDVYVVYSRNFRDWVMNGEI
jgi:hypothetical protein